MIYVYGLVASARAPSLSCIPRGLPGASVPRLIEAGEGLHVIAADVTGLTSDAIARGLQDLAWVSERALAHEAVLQHFKRARAVVPMKLFTLFRTDDRALADVKKRRRAIDAIVERVANRAEWGVRLRADARAAERAVATVRPDGKANRGVAFLQRKRDARDAARHAVARALSRAGAAHSKLAALASESVRKETALEGSPLVLDAAYLVARSDARAFRSSATKLARALAKDGIELELTGPWPPHHFVGPS